MSQILLPDRPLSRTCAECTPMLDSRCPICGKPLTGKQTSACSNVCRAALSRRKREAQDARERDLIKALAKEKGMTAEDFA